MLDLERKQGGKLLLATDKKGRLKRQTRSIFTAADAARCKICLAKGDDNLFSQHVAERKMFLSVFMSAFTSSGVHPGKCRSRRCEADFTGAGGY